VGGPRRTARAEWRASEEQGLRQRHLLGNCCEIASEEKDFAGVGVQSHELRRDGVGRPTRRHFGEMGGENAGGSGSWFAHTYPTMHSDTTGNSSYGYVDGEWDGGEPEPFFERQTGKLQHPLIHHPLIHLPLNA
jgi:hypothetical protein